MALYTNISDVAAELGGVTIDNASTPTASQVLSWIGDASAEIDEITGRVWAATIISSNNGYEYHDYDGSGRIRLKNAPIISVQLVEYEANGMSATTASWSTLAEGRTASTDYVLYKDQGILHLHASTSGRLLAPGLQNVRVQYTHGYTVTPRIIKRLCTLMVAKRFILTVSNKSASEEGGSVSVGTIRVEDPSNYVHSQLKSVNGELDKLMSEVVTKFKTKIYDVRLYD